MKVNKRLMALLLAGGLVLTGCPKGVKAENSNMSQDEIVKFCEDNASKKLSYEQFCILSYNACEYLNKFGINISVSDVFNTIFVVNYDYIEEDVKNKLINNGLVSNNTDVIITDLFNISYLISTNNHNVYIDSLENKKNVDRSKLIYLSNLSYNEKDKDVADAFDNRLTDYIDSDKTDCDIYMDLMKGFVHIPGSDLNDKHNLEFASVGMEQIINLSTGSVFEYHLKNHLEDHMIKPDSETINTLEEHINSLNNLMAVLNAKCLKK